MIAYFLSLTDGLKIHIEIVNLRSKLYNQYTFSVSGREPFCGKVPKDWTPDRVLNYWWRGECKEV